ncbi:hypothetical protein SteCoe_24572 [Stentor coeruleus]|uniref:Uncharacterized protein n=1 Tax=Stentor coeruleus TaxID=5963 RepID=A0A1R2BHB6_9CILI|nr:hypothetical protein SteCoe_24572 [Stentor coeruleus]
MKSVFLFLVTVWAMYESVIDLLFEIQKLNIRDDNNLVLSFDKNRGEFEEEIRGITAVEVDAFDAVGRAELDLKELDDELEAGQYFVQNCNKNLKHDGEQLKQIKEKKCGENMNFILQLISLSDAQESILQLREQMVEAFEKKDPVFLEKVSKVLGDMKRDFKYGYDEISGKFSDTKEMASFVELGYGVYSHSYEFSTAKRNAVDEKRTLDALYYAESKSLTYLDSDLGIILDKLLLFVQQSQKTLEEREIKTAHDIVAWEMELQKESAQLLDEIERKNLQIQKIQRDIERKNNLKNINYDVWSDVKALRENMKDSLDSFEKYEKTERDRRKHTNEAAEEALYVFETQFPEYAAYIKNKK